jgi:hypothetical protein
MALIEILHRAILLVWPIESDARQQLSRITALRLLDGQPIHKPNRFEERISSVSTYLGKAHANVADRVCQETTLSKFFTTQPCSPYILVQEESGVLRLDVYKILMQVRNAVTVYIVYLLPAAGFETRTHACMHACMHQKYTFKPKSFNRDTHTYTNFQYPTGGFQILKATILMAS